MENVRSNKDYQVMTVEVKDDPTGPTAVKVEDSPTGTAADDDDHSVVPVTNVEKSGMNSYFQDTIYIPEGYDKVKDEPGLPHSIPSDLTCSEPSTSDVGNSSFERDVPECMFECYYCKILFPSRKVLAEHLEDVHPGMADIDSILEELASNTELYKIKVQPKADDEDKGTAGNASGKKKRRIKYSEYACNYPGCGKKFIRKGALGTHQIVHELSKECPHCRVTCKTVTALIRHIERRHKVVITQQVDCTYPGCNKSFSDPQTLKDHQQVHANSRTCTQCNTSFSKIASFRRHMETQHGPGMNLTECDACGQTMTYGAVNQHKQRSCVGRDGLSCSFPGCGRKMYSKAACDNHKRVHKNQNPPLENNHSSEVLEGDGIEEVNTVYRCTEGECELTFDSKEKLDWHLKYTLHHNSKYCPNPFHCPYKSCDMLFANKTQLCDHMRAEHWGMKKKNMIAAAKLAKEVREAKPKPEGPSTQRRCPTCCETFPTEAKMKIHLNSKHGNPDTSVDAPEMLNSEPRVISEDRASEAPHKESKPSPPKKQKKHVFDLKMHKCPICQAPYHILNALKYHLQHHHKHCDVALDYLCQLESDRMAFLDVVPATLYGDSFDRKDKPRKKAQNQKQLKTKACSKTVNSQPPKKRSRKKVWPVDDNSKDSTKVSITGNSSNNDFSVPSDTGLGESDKVMDKMSVEENEVIRDANDSENGEMVDDGKSNTRKKPRKMNNLMCRYPSCFKVYKSRFDLMVHQRTHEKLLKCPTEGCEHEFFNSNNLRLHIQMVHAEPGDTKCKDCGILGKRSYIIYRHPKFCPKRMDLTCPECGKMFKKVSSYKNHVRSHSKKVRLNYVCEYEGCTKKFRTQQDRMRHHNVHSGARPYKCPYANCDKNYKQQPHLLVHIRSAHTIVPESDKRIYTCQYCGSEFKHSCGRMKHIRKSCLQGPNKDVILATRRRKPRTVSTNSDLTDE